MSRTDPTSEGRKNRGRNLLENYRQAAARKLAADPAVQAAAAARSARKGKPVIREGVGRVSADSAFRLFSVVLPAGSALSAEAVAAVDGLPKAGDPHPTRPDLAARPPMIYCVGLAENGVLLSSVSRFFNVKINYVKSQPETPDPGPQAPADLPEARGPQSGA